MKDKLNYIIFIVVIISIVLAIFGILNPNVEAAIISGLIAVFLFQQQKQKELLMELYKRKAVLYKDFVYTWVVRLLLNRDNATQVIQDYQREQIHKLILWASDDFIREFTSFLKKYRNVENNIEIVRDLGVILLTIRRDLGFKNKNISEKDILRIFIMDIDEHF